MDWKSPFNSMFDRLLWAPDRDEPTWTHARRVAKYIRWAGGFLAMYSYSYALGYLWVLEGLRAKVGLLLAGLSMTPVAIVVLCLIPGLMEDAVLCRTRHQQLWHLRAKAWLFGRRSKKH